MLLVTTDYGYTLISAVWLIIAYTLHVPTIVVKARKRAFSPEFMKTNFAQMHRQHFNYQVGKAGYPDFGNGFYSKKLDYKDWVQFNNAQRTHYNLLQWINVVIVFMCVGGLSYPIVTAIMGAVYIIGRIIYSIGYLTRKGSNGRLVGEAIQLSAFLGIIIMAFISVARIYT